MTALVTGTTTPSTEQPEAAGSSLAAVGRFVVPAYLTAALFFIIPIIDIVTLGLPAQPGSVAWRFGTVGAASNYVLTALFGAVLGSLTGVLHGDARTLRVFAVLELLAALALMVLLADFVMNALQLRASVPPPDRSAFVVGSLKAVFKYLAIGAGFCVVGIASWRAATRLRSVRR